jgi:hypothetical protein
MPLTRCHHYAVVFTAVACAACSTDVFNFTDKRLAPDASGPWVKEGASDAATTRDLEACWQVARAQVARDRRIDEDLRVRDSTAGGGQAEMDLRRDMTQFGYKRRREEIVVECMIEKGYTRK